MYYGKLHPTTSNKYSEYDRVKVEDGDTAFHEGREFRTFKELNIAVGTTYVIQAVVAVDTILTLVENFIDAGTLRFRTWAGGTPGGSFTPITSIFYTNNLTPGPNRRNNFPGVYIRQNTLLDGGTYTPGLQLDGARIKTSSNSQQAATVGGGTAGKRGIALGTYHFTFENLGNDIITGTFKLEFEELPAGYG